MYPSLDGVVRRTRYANSNEIIHVQRLSMELYIPYIPDSSCIPRILYRVTQTQDPCEVLLGFMRVSFVCIYMSPRVRGPQGDRKGYWTLQTQPAGRI
jgi:hypothetical protein